MINIRGLFTKCPYKVNLFSNVYVHCIPPDLNNPNWRNIADF